MSSCHPISPFVGDNVFGCASTKSGVDNPPYTASRKFVILAHFIIEFQKAAFPRKIGLFSWRYGILKVRMISQCHMKTRQPC